MVPSNIKADEPTQSKSDLGERRSLFLQQANGIAIPDENESTAAHYLLKLNDEEPWERSLGKLLGDSSSSLYSTSNPVSRNSSGIFLLEHSESRDMCSAMEHPEEELSLTLAPSGSFAACIYRQESLAPRDVSLMDSSFGSSLETAQSRPVKMTYRRTLYRSRSTVRSADDRYDESRQERDHIGYRDILSRRSHVCFVRQQHQELFSPAHSFDDVTNFTDEINLPFLPSLDEPAGVHDSNTLPRLPPRYDADASPLGTLVFGPFRRSERKDENEKESS